MVVLPIYIFYEIYWKKPTFHEIVVSAILPYTIERKHNTLPRIELLLSMIIGMKSNDLIKEQEH